MTRSPGENAATLLLQAARHHGPAPAIVEGGTVATYEELARRAGAVSGELQRRGIGRGDRVAMLLPRGIEAAAAYFGTLAIGAIAVPVNELLRPWQVARALDHAEAGVLLSQGEPPAGIALPWFRPAGLADGAFAPVECGSDDPAHLLYTSGSTGRPRGVLVSHANVLAGARAVTSYLGLLPSDRVASLLPFTFVYGLSQLLSSVDAGARLVVVKAVLAQDIVAQLATTEVTVVASVPAGWAQLLRVQSFTATAMPSLRLLTCAGGRLPVPHVHELRRRFPGASLYLMYGLTEVFRSSYLPPDEVDAFPDSMGRAVAGSEILVLADDGSPCAPGEIGELVHCGPTVALGYWRDAAATAAVFRDDPRPGAPVGRKTVYSGDLVHRDDSGRLYYVGRKDHMIKTLGYRVSPDEVAEVLLSSGVVGEVAVTAEPDADRGQRIVAHVVLLDGEAESRLRAHARAQLPGYMQPGRYVVHAVLPKTANGKVDYVALAGTLGPAR